MRWIDNILPRIINFLKTINGGTLDIDKNIQELFQSSYNNFNSPGFF